MDDFSPFNIEKIKTSLNSNNFREFLINKVKKTLDEMTSSNLNTSEQNGYEGVYRNNHKIEVDIDKKIIKISNQTIIPVVNMNPNIANNYPNGFDLAKAVEYGTGIVGAGSIASGEAAKDGWQYDVNNHGQSGWTYYIGETAFHTTGVTGTLIYEKTKQKIDENIDSWLMEYIESIM